MHGVFRKLITLNSSSKSLFKENFTKAKCFVIMILVVSLEYPVVSLHSKTFKYGVQLHMLISIV